MPGFWTEAIIVTVPFSTKRNGKRFNTESTEVGHRERGEEDALVYGARLLMVYAKILR
jgi:hypothetical protein